MLVLLFVATEWSNGSMEVLDKRYDGFYRGHVDEYGDQERI
jgi:hypothetical protein